MPQDRSEYFAAYYQRRKKENPEAMARNKAFAQNYFYNNREQRLLDNKNYRERNKVALKLKKILGLKSMKEAREAVAAAKEREHEQKKKAHYRKKESAEKRGAGRPVLGR